MGCNPLASDITAALGSATATDGCSSATVTFTDGAVSTAAALLRRQEYLQLSMVVVTRYYFKNGDLDK
jgi:hypothetical protein